MSRGLWPREADDSRKERNPVWIPSSHHASCLLHDSLQEKGMNESPCRQLKAFRSLDMAKGNYCRQNAICQLLELPLLASRRQGISRDRDRCPVYFGVTEVVQSEKMGLVWRNMAQSRMSRIVCRWLRSAESGASSAFQAAAYGGRGV